MKQNKPQINKRNIGIQSMSQKGAKQDILQKNVFKRIDSFFEKHEKVFLLISLSLGVIISILLFDCKVSLSGDDCDYILNAQHFIKHFTYPGGRGALYPIVLSPFLIGGLHLILLKSLSAVFIILSMWLLYKSFHGKVPPAVLMPTLLISNICPYIFFYACHTYSEPFFMLTQALFIYFFSKYFLHGEQPSSMSSTQIKKDWKKFLYIGLCFLAMGLTRTIGFAVMGVVIVYFCFQKQWKNLFYSCVSAVIILVVFNILKGIIWPEAGASYDINNYLAKNFYNPEQGMEDFSGFINRIIVNSHIYLAGFFYRFLGLRSITEVPTGDMPQLTVFTYLLFIVCFIIVFKKNKLLVFTGLYAGIMNFASFILLQTIWGQDRLIMIYYPLMLLYLMGSLYYFLKENKFRKLAWIYPLIIIGLVVGTSSHLKTKVTQNVPVLQQNLLGNDLYGLTPDWENFIKMSRWANENLDKEAVIASRKPSISYVYTGREFFGIFNVPFVNIMEIAEKYKAEKEDYLFLSIEYQQDQPLIAGLAPYLQYIFTSKQGGVYNMNDHSITAVFVYKINKNLMAREIIEFLDVNNYNYTFDYDTFLKQYIEDKNLNYQIIDPDMLLEVIKENHIRYLILGKIRLYTPQNTGRFINTIHQYVSFIQFKYPNQFDMIHSIGKDESCELAEFIGE